METRYVREFIEIVKYSNFSAAASDLFISQSTLTKHIQSLEETLGLKLFDRTTRKVQLSPAGAVFLKYAEQIYETENKCIEALKEYKTAGKSKLVIGNTPVMAFYGILSTIYAFQKLYPDIEIEIIEYNGNTVNKALSDGDFELAFYDKTSIKESHDIEATKFCDDYLVAVMHKDHPLAGENTVNVRDLCKERLLFFNKTTPIYEIAYKLCLDAGFTPNIYFSGVRFENLLELVSLNMGVAMVMKKFTMQSGTANVVIKDIFPTATRTIVLARVSSKKPSNEADMFWNYISKNVL